MSAETNALHRSVPKVPNFGGPEEELAAEDSPKRDCLPGRSFPKPTTAATCLLPFKYCNVYPEDAGLRKQTFCMPDKKWNFTIGSEHILEFTNIMN
jgi:hypothetical protein